ETRTTLQRVNSKSLPQITKTLCEYRGCEACEVCKQGTITSRIYFPTTALNPRSTGSQQDVKRKTEKTITMRSFHETTPELSDDQSPLWLRPPYRDQAERMRPRKSWIRSDQPLPVHHREEYLPENPPKRECLGYSQVSVVSAEMP
ncbi:hypothetical protein OSTOST_15639, partial [Ostertagia ostertagi]